MERKLPMRKGRIIFPVAVAAILLALIIIFLLLPRFIDRDEVSPDEFSSARDFLKSTLDDPRYSYTDYLGDNGALIKYTDFAGTEVPEDGGMTELPGGEEAVFTVNVPEEGLYELALDCLIPDGTYFNGSAEVTVNGAEPFYEARNIDIQVIWQDESKTFPIDRYGDESVPQQLNVVGWREVDFYNTTYLSDTPLLFKLNKGENKVAVRNTTASAFGIGLLHVDGMTELPSYDEYISGYADAPRYDGVYSINAIDYKKKNSSWITLDSSTDPSATPTHPVNNKINMLYMYDAGVEAVFEADVPQDGLYSFALHTMLASYDFNSFVTLKIDGVSPFEEAVSYPLLPYDDDAWHNELFEDENGNPYELYLTAGKHEIAMRIEIAPLREALNSLQLLADHINDFSIEIRKVTGRDVDANRTWRLTRYIPETAEYLDAYDVVLRDILHKLKGFSPNKGMDASILSDINAALAFLDQLKEKPDELPLYLETLSGNNSSVLQYVSTCLDSLLSQGFTLDMIYLYGKESELPPENAGVFTQLGNSVQQIWASYTSDKFTVKNQEEAINVWVNRTTLHADALQKLCDTQFTAETGQTVNVSVMPDVNKLVLACAAGTQPDVALAVQTHTTFDLASRNALLDLTQFPDFWQTAKRTIPGAFTGSVFNDKIYAMPELSEFNVLVYRTDILKQLNLEVPDTWDDVCEIMSELQRFDMSFYHPIASGEGYKWFYQTVPLIYQNGGALYTEDGLSTAINEPAALKGINLLGELFTTYALAEQVPSFSSAFRYGKTPIGILGLNDYVILKRGAPELTGQWEMSANPGTVQEDGSVSRWFISNVQGGIIFKDTNKAAKSWDFLKWWTSADVQSQYAFTMYSVYGLIWLSANTEALKNAPIPYEDLSIIIDNVQWMRDTPRSPGQYMLERKLSDIWNSMVFEGVTAQVAVDLNIIDIQREFQRKMREFGFIGGDEPVEYHVRELDWVAEKMNTEGVRQS